MAYKKLKIFVVTALIAFILTVANILAFGLIQKEMAAVPDKGSNRIVSIVEKNETSQNNSNNETINNPPLVEQNGTNTTPPATPPADPPVTPPRRTRAS
jgi:hypothetical protein